MHTREKGRERMKAHTTQVPRVDISVRKDFLMSAKLKIFFVFWILHSKEIYVQSIRHMIHVLRQPCLGYASFEMCENWFFNKYVTYM